MSKTTSRAKKIQTKRQINVFFSKKSSLSNFVIVYARDLFHINLDYFAWDDVYEF